MADSTVTFVQVTESTAVPLKAVDLGGGVYALAIGFSGGSDGVSLVDNAAFTDGTSRVAPAGFVYDEVAGVTPLSENDIGAARIDLKRAQVFTLEDATTRGRRQTVNADGSINAVGSSVTVTTSVTRPADTNAYTANDVWADSTTVPTAGGFTLTSMGRVSGGGGVITDLFVISSANPGTLLQGEIHIFDSSVTAVNDNAAYTITDNEALTLVAVIPFTLTANNLNSVAHIQNLAIGFTTVGSANLRFLIKVKNAYTPISGEILTVRAKVIHSN